MRVGAIAGAGGIQINDVERARPVAPEGAGSVDWVGAVGRLGFEAALYEPYHLAGSQVDGGNDVETHQRVVTASHDCSLATSMPSRYYNDMDPAETRPHSAFASASDAWRTSELDVLCDAFLTLASRDEMTAFLRDICTLGELEALGHRLAAARLLDRGEASYADIARQVRSSTTTVTRVAHWLRYGEGGYRIVLDRLRNGST
jgi:TrpR-related protein YerC/YecD